MELRLLRSFVTVAEELHFSRASVRLNMAQPPLSRQIKSLEEELGVRLLHRTRRHVSLTEPGRAFLVSARGLLAQAEEAVDHVRRVARGEAGRLALGITSSVAFGETLPRVLRRFRSHHSGVSISLQELSPAEQMEALRAGRIHLGFMRSPEPDPGLVLTPFGREPLVAVLPAEHPLASRVRIPLRALAKDPFITVPRGQSLGGMDLILEACLEAGFRPRVAQQALELPSVIGYVAAGFGVSLLPQTSRNLSHSGVAFVSLTPPRPVFEISAVHLAGQDSPVMEAFLQALQTRASGRASSRT